MEFAVRGTPMIRAVGLFGLGGGFLMISPKLRETLYESASAVVASMERYSPYSYIGAGVGLMCLLMLTLYKASAPR
jgi:hypothetical protein